MDTEVTREELHFRRVDMRGYRRSDGLYEVVGQVTDTKSHALRPLLGDREVPAGERLHDMGVRIVFDTAMTVVEIETFTDAAPYAICPAGGDALQSLKGLRMTSGWNRLVRERLAGAASCLHLTHLLGPMATVAFQTMTPRRQALEIERDASGRPLKIDTCYAYGAEQELVREHWPDFATPKGES